MTFEDRVLYYIWILYLKKKEKNLEKKAMKNGLVAIAVVVGEIARGKNERTVCARLVCGSSIFVFFEEENEETCWFGGWMFLITAMFC